VALRARESERALRTFDSRVPDCGTHTVPGDRVFFAYRKCKSVINAREYSFE
jgi:hypothetical protein